MFGVVGDETLVLAGLQRGKHLVDHALRLGVVAIQHGTADQGRPFLIVCNRRLVHVARNVIRVHEEHRVFHAVQQGGEQCGIGHGASMADD